MLHSTLFSAAVAAIPSTGVEAIMTTVVINPKQSYAEFKVANAALATKALAGLDQLLIKELGSNAGSLIAKTGANMNDPESVQGNINKSLMAAIAWHFATVANSNEAIRKQVIEFNNQVSKLYSRDPKWVPLKHLFTDFLTRATLITSNNIPVTMQDSDCVIRINPVTSNITVETNHGKLHFVPLSLEDDGLLMFCEDETGKEPLVQINTFDGYAVDMITKLQKARGEF